MSSTYNAIYISPHLDDVVLSCGGQIYQRTQAGEKVLVVTLAAGDPPVEGLSPLALSMQKSWDLLVEAGERRRDEDQHACRLISADYCHWPFQEGIYRYDKKGIPLYPTLAALFGKIAGGDEETIQLWAKKMGDLSPEPEVYLPLGAGGHVDHQIARLAGEKAFAAKKIHYYEDFPYAQRFLAVRKLTWPRRQWRSELLRLTPEAIKARIAAISAYPSQAWVIFGGPADLEFKVRRYLKRVGGGERIWGYLARP